MNLRLSSQELPLEVDAPGIVGECPAATLQVVQITWEGGVSGPMGSALGGASAPWYLRAKSRRPDPYPYRVSG